MRVSAQEGRRGKGKIEEGFHQVPQLSSRSRRRGIHGLPLPIRDLLLSCWFCRQPLRLRSVPVTCTDVQADPESQIDGAVRWAPLPALPAQLLHLLVVWAPLGLWRQAPRRHRQRHRSGVSARLHFPLLHLRRQQKDKAEDHRAPCARGLRVCPCRIHQSLLLRPDDEAAVRRRREHGVAHLNVCFSISRHGRGDPDGVLGVHALLPVPLYVAHELLIRDIWVAAA